MHTTNLSIPTFIAISALITYLFIAPEASVASGEQEETTMQEVQELPVNKLREPVMAIMSYSMEQLQSKITELENAVQALKTESEVNKNKIEMLTSQVVSITQALKDNPALQNMQKFGGK